MCACVRACVRVLGGNGENIPYIFCLFWLEATDRLLKDRFDCSCSEGQKQVIFGYSVNFCNFLQNHLMTFLFVYSFWGVLLLNFQEMELI